MTTVPIGQGAYERLAAGTPQVRLENRWLEASPTNLREHVKLLARPGTAPQLTFSQGGFTAQGPMRGQYYFAGLFDDAMFVVCGNTLYRVDLDLTVTPISGVISGTGHPELAWQKGAGFERLFITDGLLLQFYAGTTGANGTLTLAGAPTATPGTFEVGGVFYSWGTGFSNADNGTAAHPFLVNPNRATGGALDPLNQLVLAIMDSGTPGVDYSATIGGPNTLVTAVANGVFAPAATSVKFTAIAPGVGGNSITTTVTAGTALSFGHGTLQNGGVNALEGVTMPNGVAAQALAQVSGFVLVSQANSQQFFWLNPGEVTIDPLNFANKESSPDNIVSMKTVGDQVLMIGEASTENWYATGDLQAPFAPIEGRVYQHGAIEGTPCIVGDAVMLVADDGVAYSIGYLAGGTAPGGVNRISNHGIEERIRRQIRREQGLTP